MDTYLQGKVKCSIHVYLCNKHIRISSISNTSIICHSYLGDYVGDVVRILGCPEAVRGFKRLGKLQGRVLRRIQKCLQVARAQQ